MTSRKGAVGFNFKNYISSIQINLLCDVGHGIFSIRSLYKRTAQMIGSLAARSLSREI